MLKTKRTTLLYVIAFALIFEGFAAAGLYFSGRPIHIIPKQPRDVSFPLQSEEKPWGAWGQPGTTSRMVGQCYAAEYAYNSYGARDKERNETGNNRWIVLGDSFVEGYGIAVEDRFTNLLEKVTTTEFLNFGASGNFGPLQYLLLYRDLKHKFEHSGVIVGFLPANDFVDNNTAYWSKAYSAAHRTRYRPYFARCPKSGARKIIYGVDGEGIKRGNLHERPFDTNASTAKSAKPGPHPLSRAMRAAARYTATASFAVQIYDQLKFNNENAHHASLNLGYFTNDKELIDDARWALQKIGDESGERQKVLLVLPTQHDLERRRRNGRPFSTEITAFLHDLNLSGWKIIDVAKAFETEPQVREITLGCDGHWNAAAHERAATYLAKRFKYGQSKKQ